MRILSLIILITIFWLVLKLTSRLFALYLVLRKDGLQGVLAALLRKYDGQTIYSEQAQAQNKQEKMVKCRKCGLYILEQQAYNKGLNYFCCKEHAE